MAGNGDDGSGSVGSGGSDGQAVALGERHADLVVRGGEAVLVERGVVERRDVVVAGDRIAALTSDGSDAIGPDTRVVDATDRYVVPGFVDAHAHLDGPVTVETAYHRSLAGGTTAVVTETSDLCLGSGPDALAAHLEATADLPLTVHPTVPPHWFYDLFEPRLGTDEECARLAAFLDHDRVVGVGELDWIFVTGRSSPVQELVDWAGTAGARVCGHGAGCRGDRYAAFASVVDNDHEAIDAEGVRERLDAGVHVIGRCGTGRDDVAAVADVIGAVDPTDVSLSTDGLSPGDLLSRGHMDAVVRRAIEAGVDPVDAVRMATVAPARHFDLDCGTLAPGATADVVVLEDLADVTVETVVADGDVVVEGGEPLVGPRPHSYPDPVRDSVTLSVPDDAFTVSAAAARDGAVRAIGFGNGFVTSSETVSPPAEEGDLLADGDAGVCKAALCCRHPRRGGAFTGFLTGFGLQSGAIATSVTREVPGVAVVGADEGAMRRATSRVAALGGGCVLADADGVREEVALPVGGAATDAPIREVADGFDAVERELHARGVEHDRPLLGVETLSFRGVPSLKLSFSGYADVLGRDVVGLAPPSE